MKDKYNELLSDGFLNSDITTDGFVNNPNNLERGDSWGRQLISIVKTESMTSGLLQDFKCPNDKLKLTAFLILHATGHNAGIRHCEDDGLFFDNLKTSNPPGFGYMMSGGCIITVLGKNAICKELSYQDLKIYDTPNNYNSIDELILKENILPSLNMQHQLSIIFQRFNW